MDSQEAIVDQEVLFHAGTYSKIAFTSVILSVFLRLPVFIPKRPV